MNSNIEGIESGYYLFYSKGYHSEARYIEVLSNRDNSPFQYWAYLNRDGAVGDIDFQTTKAILFDRVEKRILVKISNAEYKANQFGLL